MRLSIVASLACLHCSYAVKVADGLNDPFFSSHFGQPGNATFDYVVIGGGTAGLTIASRLAVHHSVAVIEAGGFYQIQNGNGSIIPAMAALQAAGSAPNLTLPLVDWGIVTPPQSSINNRRLHYARGKTLGGTSARHFMLYHRATKGSYQQWADQVGDQSYTFDKLLPYFKRSCQITAPDMTKRQPNGSVSYDPTVFDNSLGGPLQVSWPNWADPFASWALKGLNALGLPTNSLNFNSGQLSGSAWVTSTINPTNSHRDSSQTSFLNEAMLTTDIVVYTETMAKRILFDANKTATGVLVDQAGARFVVSANKEVILSAGAFQSPQMLMVSGIGPKATLKGKDIAVVSDLPGVGQNLQDQPLFGTSHRVNVITGSDLVNHPSHAMAAAQMFRNNASGPYTSCSTAVGWEKIPDAYRANFSSTAQAALAQYPADWPELELSVEAGFSGYNLDYATADPADGHNYATIVAIMVAPLSRGNVTIASADSADLPVVNPAWLQDPTDQEVAVASIKRVRDLWAAIPDLTIGPEYFPGVANVSTDAEILNYVRDAIIPVWHASSTCAMGRRGDRMAVIDSQARVFGVQRLRVVDSSAFPFLPPGHPQATIYALAEKIADHILCHNKAGAEKSYMDDQK